MKNHKNDKNFFLTFLTCSSNYNDKFIIFNYKNVFDGKCLNLWVTIYIKLLTNNLFYDLKFVTFDLLFYNIIGNLVFYRLQNNLFIW